MNQFFAHLDDVVAIILVVGCLTLKALDIDGATENVIYLGAAYAFGKGTQIATTKLNGK